MSRRSKVWRASKGPPTSPCPAPAVSGDDIYRGLRNTQLRRLDLGIIALILAVTFKKKLKINQNRGKI